MIQKSSGIALFFSTIAALTPLPAAALLTVDGNLVDWGVKVRDSSTSTPESVFSTVSVGPQAQLFSYAIEDTDDLAGQNVYLGPHYGGQNYDVEFMAVARQGSRIFLSIVSGQRPDNGFSYYSPGDVRITDNTGRVFGIEVGGGPGGAAAPGKITTGAAGTTYSLNSSGITTGVSSTAARQTAGSIWSNVDWMSSPIAGDTTPVQFAINSHSRLLGSADYIYTLDSVTRQHSVIEMSFDAALFAGASTLDFSWAPACDNDLLQVRDDLAGTLPEPGSLALCALALAGLAIQRRRAAPRG